MSRFFIYKWNALFSLIQRYITNLYLQTALPRNILWSRIKYHPNLPQMVFWSLAIALQGWELFASFNTS